jgi:hypothetical protein
VTKVDAWSIVYVAISLQSPDSSRFTARIRLGPCYTIIDTSQIIRHCELRVERLVQVNICMMMGSLSRSDCEDTVYYE